MGPKKKECLIRYLKYNEPLFDSDVGIEMKTFRCSRRQKMFWEYLKIYSKKLYYEIK